MSPFWQSAADFGLRTLLSAGVATLILGWVGKRWLAGVEHKYARRLEDLKAKYEAELQHSKQLLQAEIDKTFLVTKVHFETEFQALKQVFAVLAEVRLQLPNLRPQMRIERSDETRENRIEDLHKTHGVLSDLDDRLVSVSENQKPFYPSEIYAQVGECRQILRSELNDVVLATDDEQFKHEWYRKGVENQKLFLISYSKVSELIRNRISRLAIVRSNSE